jgi:hypothetical protein
VNQLRLGLILGIVLTGLSCSKSVQSRNPVAQVATSAPSGPRIVEYAPGLRIDYRVPQVEIDAEVILREASLELFLYSKAPTPKEHESILKTQVPAHRIFEALGLIGFQPGKPMRYSQETDTVRPASGDPVAVFVRYAKDGREIEEPATNWMMDASTKKTMAPVNWLFTGSEKTQEGDFAADVEGTTICVVDFPRSLLSLPSSHTSSDAELWLKANTEKIPPLRTKVVVVLRKP